MDIEQLKERYKESILTCSQEYKRINKQYYTLGTVRLLVVLATIVCAYLLKDFKWPFIVFDLLAGALVFSGLVVRQKKLNKKKTFLKTSIAYYKSELKAFDYNFSDFDGALEAIDSKHNFSFDLDLFGNDSVFQSVNRTCTPYGKKILVEWFENPLSAKEEIEKRQEAVKELESSDRRIFNFLITGLCNKGKDSDLEEIESFRKFSPFTAHIKRWKYISFCVPFLWIALIALFCFGILNGYLLSLFIIAGLITGESFNKKISRLSLFLGNKIKILKTYADLISLIEQKNYESNILKEIKSAFVKEDGSASEKFHELVKLFQALEIRDNLIGRFLFNTLFLWDIRKTIKIEEWREKYGKDMAEWIRKIGEYDAFNSIALYTYNHPSYIFPKITDRYFRLEGKSVGHPLLPRQKCVCNDLSINTDPFFIIVTGANMAGKSTYLRTIGVNYVMACMGMPVFAESFVFSPAQLVTSIRTDDSLTGNESYFFAELKRLKMIIDKLNKGEKLFIILDEILKGTNSVDKQKGSLALMQQFIRLDACGIIATHDLLLGSLENEFPSNAKNFCFEADIDNDKLTFSYKMKTGIAQNMNACFLMRKMGITI